MKKCMLLGMFVLAVSCNKQEVKQFDDKGLLTEIDGVLAPLPASLIDTKSNKDLIHLGKTLYFEKKLSINDTISCNSCHKLDQFGVDNLPTSPGHDGTLGGRNSPTVYNAALNFLQFWDGRAKDVEEQALGPILNPVEHGLAQASDAMKKIDTQEYRELFERAFGNKEAFNFNNVGVAIGAFEKTLLTPSRYDEYLNGDHSALSYQEKVGLKKFNEIGCTTCHDGANVGGGMFQKLGLAEEYPTKDEGRFEVTKNEDDKFFFKVPTLRNITKTAPYFHDGSVKTLDEAITIMAKHQLGVEISAEDRESIKAFLGSLEAKALPKM
ncbi:cytochrome c peroxidase [Oceanospirillum sp. RT-1-3]|uniref:cytochrome c peroxidase n=1 Tax=unclassified Halobacteriovorax TaxID=2639665 RepID=UPI00399C395C